MEDGWLDGWRMEPDMCGCLREKCGPMGCRELPPNSTICEDVDECAKAEDLCLGGTCVNTQGSYECLCQPGSTLDSTGRFCIDSQRVKREKYNIPQQIVADGSVPSSRANHCMCSPAIQKSITLWTPRIRWKDACSNSKRCRC